MLNNDPIRDMLAIGAVGPRHARIWVRVERPGRYTLTWSPTSGGAPHSTDLVIEDRRADLTGVATLDSGLAADTRYRVVLTREPHRPLATGSFLTYPDPSQPPEQFSLALMSCHQPFDDDGRVRPATQDMLEAVNRAFLEHRVRAVVMAGDQLYSDYPRQASLLDPEYFRTVAPKGRSELLECSAQEIRELFHARYRHFWNIRGWRELLANYPCYPILDDHEIVDNWGSAEEHSSPKWQAFREGAFQAYADYQGSRVSRGDGAPPDCFDYSMALADTATYVMDLRSNRHVGAHPRLVSPHQLDAFRSFLDDHADKHVVFVVLSVPLLHLPRALSRVAAAITPDGEDFSDRWSSSGHREDRDRVLRALHEHQRRNPHQRVVLLSGDIHIGCLHRIRWPDIDANLFQFVSSGVTHDVGPFIQGLSSAIIRAHRSIRFDESGASTKATLRLVRGEAGARSNPCGRLNVGIVEVFRDERSQPPTLRFLQYSHDGARPRCRYRSPPSRPP